MKKLAFVFVAIMLIGLLPVTACQTDEVKDTSAPVESTGTGDETARLFESIIQTGSLGAALEEKETATFAGCWKEGSRFVIAFTGNGEETIKKYVKEGSELAGIIDLLTFDFTFEELKAAQQEAMRILDELDLFCSTGIDIKVNHAEVFVTDSELFYQTLQEAGTQLPDLVKVIVTYEPLREVPFEVNPDPSVHFPQLKMASGSYMLALLTGKLTLKDGCLCVEDTIIIWQPDYFLNSNNGTIEILDREGKVVARLGEEVVIGGGGYSVPIEDINRMLKEPLPSGCDGPFWIQGTETRLSLHFSSELFSLEVIPSGTHDFYFFKKKPPLDKASPSMESVTGKFIASYGDRLLKIPFIFVEEKPEENKSSLQFAVFWPADYRALVENGVFKILDGTGNVVLRDGDEVTIEGGVIYGATSGIPWQLHNELPGGCTQPYLIVNEIVGE